MYIAGPFVPSYFQSIGGLGHFDYLMYEGKIRLCRNKITERTV